MEVNDKEFVDQTPRQNLSFFSIKVQQMIKRREKNREKREKKLRSPTSASKWKMARVVLKYPRNGKTQKVLVLGIFTIQSCEAINCGSLHKLHACVCATPHHTHTYTPLLSHSSIHPLRKQQAELILLTWCCSLPFSPHSLSVYFAKVDYSSYTTATTWFPPKNSPEMFVRCDKTDKTKWKLYFCFIHWLTIIITIVFLEVLITVLLAL